ncbi:fibroblast growth factor 5 isoform X2 [Lepidochelys kempii]|uniref:fibroblast growth factor 5 isoform X2 n=1 Tax=Lepidochelys kempii TaxID=8472 RepID=UPI003C6F5E2A
MSLSFCCLLSLSRLILSSALAPLPPGAQLGQAARAGGASSALSPSSSSSPSLGAKGSGPERSSFQWSPSGRRTGSLYCRVGIGFHLQIHPDGKVNGSHEANLLSILEIFAVSQGIVGIRGVFSNKFLAMSKKGKLHASAKFTEDCKFRERFQENSYNTYASAVYRTERTGRECSGLYKDFLTAQHSAGDKKGNSFPVDALLSPVGWGNEIEHTLSLTAELYPPDTEWTKP